MPASFFTSGIQHANTATQIHFNTAQFLPTCVAGPIDLNGKQGIISLDGYGDHELNISIVGNVEFEVTSPMQLTNLNISGGDYFVDGKGKVTVTGELRLEGGMNVKGIIVTSSTRIRMKSNGNGKMPTIFVNESTTPQGRVLSDDLQEVAEELIAEYTGDLGVKIARTLVSNIKGNEKCTEWANKAKVEGLPSGNFFRKKATKMACESEAGQAYGLIMTIIEQLPLGLSEWQLGLVAGGVAVLVILFAISCSCCCKKDKKGRKKRAQDDDSEEARPRKAKKKSKKQVVDESSESEEVKPKKKPKKKTPVPDESYSEEEVKPKKKATSSQQQPPAYTAPPPGYGQPPAPGHGWQAPPGYAQAPAWFVRLGWHHAGLICGIELEINERYNTRGHPRNTTIEHVYFPSSLPSGSDKNSRNSSSRIRAMPRSMEDSAHSLRSFSDGLLKIALRRHSSSPSRPHRGRSHELPQDRPHSA